MSRRTPVKELQTEDVAEGSLRRSSRLAYNSPAPVKIPQRRNSGSSSSNDVPAKITKTKRLSLSQESSVDSADHKTLQEMATIGTPKKTRSTRSASKSPTMLAKETNTKAASVKTRGRRGSQSKSIDEEKIDNPAPPSSRLRSTRSESKSPISVKDVEPAKPRTRRGSITEKVNQLEKIEETEPTATESKKRYKGIKSSVSEMSQLDVIEETEVNKKDTEKQDLESIKEATETDEKGKASTSSERGYTEKTEKDGKDKFKLSPIVRIEKSKTIADLTALPRPERSAIMDKPGADLTEKKIEDDTQPDSEPGKDKLDPATVEEASSSEKVEEKENIPLAITNKTTDLNILESDGAKSSPTLINEEKMDSVSENNIPQSIQSVSPDGILEKSTKVENKTQSSDTPEEEEVISKKNVEVTSAKDHVDTKNVPSNNETEAMNTSGLKPEATTKLAIEDEIIVKDIDKLLGTTKGENITDSDLGSCVKTKKESRDQHIDIPIEIKDPDLNVSDTVDVDVDIEKLEVGNDVSTTDTNLTTPTKTKDFAKEYLTYEVLSPPSDESLKKEKSCASINDKTEKLANEDKDSKLALSSSEDVAIDNVDKVDDDKPISKATTLLKDCNRSLTNLIPDLLDMSLGSDGSFRMNLSLQNIESCSSKEDLSEENKDKNETGGLNTSGSSDKENQENNELFKQVQQNSPKAGNLDEIKVAVTNISSNEVDQTPKDTSFFEPMEVDDPSLSFVESSPNIEKRSLDNGAKCATTYTIDRESTDSYNVSVETVKAIVSCKDVIDTEKSDKVEICKDTSMDEKESNESKGITEITPTSVNTVEVDVTMDKNVTDKVTTELNINENNLKSINEMDATSKCNEIEKNIDESEENQEKLPEIDESINKSISENRENKEEEYSSPVFSITNADISDEEQNDSPVQIKSTIRTEGDLKETHENNGHAIQEEDSTTKEGIDNISTIITDSTNMVETKEISEIVIEKGKEAATISETLEENSVVDVKCTLSKSLNSSGSINEEEVDRSEVLITEGKSINSDINTSQAGDENGVTVENISTESKTSISKSPEKKRISLKKADNSHEISELKSTCSTKEDADIESTGEIHIHSEVIKAKRNSNNKAEHRSPKGKDKKTRRQSEEITAQILTDVHDQVLETSKKIKKLKTSDVYNIEAETKGKRQKSGLEKHSDGKKKCTSPTKKDIKRKKFSQNEESVLEKETELDKDQTMVISSNSEDEQDASEFIVDMAEEGEEDTPSEGSNDIICEGESINSDDTYTEDDDDSYGDDSFIDDGDEKHELLSGEESFLQSTLPGEVKAPKSRKSNDKTKASKKHKRIITPSESEDDQHEVITEEKADKQVNEGDEEAAEVMSELKSSGIEDETVNKGPEELAPQVTEDPANIPIDLMPSKNDVIHVDSDSDSESLSGKEGQKTQNELNGSSSSVFEKKSKRKSSISIQENIKLEDIQDGELSERISKVVDWFYSGIKGSSDAGNISLNVSLDYADQSPNEESIVINDDIVMKSEDILKKSMKRISDQTIEAKSVEEDLSDQLVDSVFVTDSEESIKPSKQGKKLKRKSLQKQQKDTEDDGEIDVSEKLAPVKKSNKRHSREFEIQTDDDLDEAVAKGAKRLSGEKIQHVSPKRSKLETDFVVENIPSEKPKKKKSKKDQHGDSTTKESIEGLEIDYSKNKSKKVKKSPTKENSMGAGSPKTKIADAFVVSKNKRKTKPATIQTAIIDESNLKSRENKAQKRRKVSTSDEESIGAANLRYTSLRRANKPSASKLKREITDVEFDVEIESINVNKNKKNSHKKKKTDHIPCSSGIVRQHVTSKTSASKREVDGFPQKEGKLKRKIPQRLLPTKTMDLGDSWESEIFDASLHPSVSNKKILEAGASKKKKTDVDSFNSKDFKNRMLYDSSRVKRMDTKALLKQRKKF